MPRVMHFEILADNPERAIRFYQMVFGWQVHKWVGQRDYWLIATGPENEPGIDGAIMRRNQPLPKDGNTAYVCSINVHSIDEYLPRINANGGLIASPKIAITGIGWMVYARDSEGNIFSMMQSDPNAR